MMKIALVTKEFLPQRGGAERYSEALATTLARLGHELHIFSARFAPEVVPLFQLHQVGWPWYPHPVKSLAFISKMHKAILAAGPFDIVYALTHYYPADMYRAGDGVQRHWAQINHPNLIARTVAQLMPKRLATLYVERAIYNTSHCRAIVTNSQLVKHHIQTFYPFPASNIHVVYNGVDQRLFCPGTAQTREAWRHKWSIGEKTMVLLFVAHNWKRKGLTTLLQGSARLLRERLAMVVVIGRGKPNAWQPLLQKLEIAGQVLFIPATPEIVAWYQNADVLVLPTQYDPFSNVCLEAMACGLPVITTQENGASELIRPGQNGYILSSARAHEELAVQLAAMQDPQKRHDLGKDAFETAQTFTVERNALETLEVCRKIKN